MLIINDTPGAKVTTADVMPGLKVGTSDFAIKTEATNPYSAYIIADNYGSKYTGHYRANIGISANSPLGYGDKFGINGVLSTTTDLKNGKVYYNFPLMPNGLRGELSASKTSYSLAEEYEALDAIGTSTTLEASVSYPLIRTREETLKLSLGYAHKNMEDEVQSTSTLTKKESDALNLGATYTKSCTLFGLPSSTTASLTLTAGNLDSPDNLDTDGSYSKVAGSIEKEIQFNPEFALTTSLRFQKALRDKNLDGSEDFSLGGAYGVRAFPDGEHSSENGYLLGAELFYTLPSTQSINHKASIFADTGYASMQKDNGISESRHLSDIGLGYQAFYKAFFAKAQVARVIGGEKVESEDKDSTRVLLQFGWVY
jgi:hemolysin activation/secretion protein